MFRVFLTELIMTKLTTESRAAPCLVAVCYKAMELPFYPFPGLILALTDQASEMGGDFVVDEVLWDNTLRQFVCEQETVLSSHAMTLEAAQNRSLNGWEVAYQ
jgi:hypothetical protein